MSESHLKPYMLRLAERQAGEQIHIYRLYLKLFLGEGKILTYT